MTRQAGSRSDMAILGLPITITVPYKKLLPGSPSVRYQAGLWQFAIHRSVCRDRPPSMGCGARAPDGADVNLLYLTFRYVLPAASAAARR